ncbi:MAG: hypothetical protein PVF07_05345, partial [Thiogranum sp.]
MRYTALMILFSSILITGCDLKHGDSSPSSPAAVDPSVQPDSFLSFANRGLVASVDTENYAEAYYNAVDPVDPNTGTGRRTTLAAWKEKTGFNDPGVVVINATFRDTRDLGYGRDMYAWEIPDNRGGGVAVYVDNYVVELEPGDASSYDRLSLDAAVQRDRNFLFGTNAIEFSPEALDDPNNPDPSSPMIAKFFTFAPDDRTGTQARLGALDIDGRGAKHMPLTCVVCHGGTLYPLKADGSFEPISLKSPKLNILQQDSLQFSSTPQYTEADQKRNIAAINQLVYKTYVEMEGRADSASDQANWDAGFAKELLEGAYPGIDTKSPTDPDFPDYDTGFIPPGWDSTKDSTLPSGVDQLYKQVVEPYCIGCHTLRGTRLAEARDAADMSTPPIYANAVNFSSYEKFISYADTTIDYVYQRGFMPDSLITYTQFWQDPEGAPTLLSTFLPGFDLLQDGKVVEPGRAVARPGANTTVASLPVTLNAGASLFSTSYAWTISSLYDGIVTFSDSSSATPELMVIQGQSLPEGSDVMLGLTTANANGESTPAEVTIRVDSTTQPANPTFLSAIKEPGVLSGSGSPDRVGRCTGCHNRGDTPP